MQDGVEIGIPEPKNIERITIKDIEPAIPEIGGTVIVLQRNAKDNREVSPNSPEFGAILPEEAKQARLESKSFFDEMFTKLSPEDRETLSILVVAANTKLIMPDGRTSDHKRALETAEQEMIGIKESMAEYSISDDQLLNKNAKPIELTTGKLTDLKILKDSPEFVEFLKGKYGTGVEFWTAYEDDIEKETREKMGAEGPGNIADRVNSYVVVLSNAMKLWHEHHPNRRVVVIAVGHYDNFSPFFKQDVLGMDMNKFLKVDYRGGIVIDINKDQQATSKIQGQEYNINLT